MISRALIFGVLALSSAFADLNDVVLQQIRAMPNGGGYATTLAAHAALASSVDVADSVRIRPEHAMPGYCSGATYLVFLKTLQALQDKGTISLSPKTWNALVPRLRPDGEDTLPDGESVWGRWNANGPGTARLFHELGLGRNFTNFSAARPGDFLKIFWTDAVGKKENGHSVVFLGLETVDGVERVRFWSSNRPGGFGESSVLRGKIARAIFSRLEHPEKISGWAQLPETDAYLASLLATESTFLEAMKMSGIVEQ
ncbi:MAG: hypothetical protein WBX20_08875 [Terrimicrobiaceae bacterium]